jgi:phosphoribosyl-ATP pyrophosphohydrolase/phosphoribosyl-AMP cyclohydrolase
MKIDFKKLNGLIPAVIQDEVSMEVLMLGFMNWEAYLKTKKTGVVWFYSRTKERLWKKGESSGNVLNVKSMSLDCDRDTILIKVQPVGPICHTGSNACFKRKNNDLGILGNLLKVIDDRYKKRPAGSYTTKLFNSDISRVAQKVGEEGVETALASVRGTKKELIGESVDLIYHLLVLLKVKKITWKELFKKMDERSK